MIIKEIKTPSEKEEIFRFRYRIYEKEMRRGCQHANHELETISDSMDEKGMVFAAYDNGVLVATGRVNIASQGPVEPENVYRFSRLSRSRKEKTAVASKVMVDPEYRGIGVYLKLVKAMYKRLIECGVEEIYLDCNAPLDRLYARLGFIAVRKEIHPEYGSVTVMSLASLDFVHLSKTKSPLITELSDWKRAQFDNAAIARSNAYQDMFFQPQFR